MHRLRFIIRRDAVLLRQHLSENVESFGQSFSRNFQTHRSLGSEKSGSSGGDDTNDTVEVSKSSSGTQNERSKKAKVKLDNLLRSIVQDSKKDAAERKIASESHAIDMKLAIPMKEKPVIVEESQQTVEEKETEKDLGVEMVDAVKKVAESMEGDPKAVESELVQKLKTQVGKKVNLSDLFAGMKIDRSSKASSSGDMELSRAHRVRKLLDERTKESRRILDKSSTPQVPRQRRVPVSKPTYMPIDLFGAPPLGIFHAKSETTVDTKDIPKTQRLATWDLLNARDLKLNVTHPPANGFEEMILWTEQGKLWKFPINNEQDLDEEAKVPFHEHVFLEPQIEGWCPKKGPIRHFMELVCVGLSKNPFLTVKEKHDQIEWYHQYFKAKASIIKEVGAGEIK